MRIAFSTTNYKYLLDSIINYQFVDKKIRSSRGTPSTKIIREGDIERKIFPDGETYHKLDNVAGKDVIIVGGTTTDSETLELFDIGCSVVKHGAKTLTLIIPYYGYSTMERAVEPGEIVKAKTRARLLSAIPSASRNRVIFVDLHSEGIPHYLENGIQPIHLYAKPLIVDICKEIAGMDFVLASTDAGRAKWVESLANDMGVECAILIKRRLSGTSTEVVGVNANVKDKTVIIYDDMIRTGGSIVKAAAVYKEAGALKVFVVATHGVFPERAVSNMQNCGFIEQVFVTNTHEASHTLSLTKGAAPFIQVRDIGPLICKYLYKH